MKQLFSIISIILIATTSASGADMPSAVIEAIDIPVYVKPAKFNYKVLVTNNGKTSLQSLSFKTRVGEVDYDRAVALSPSIKQGNSSWVEIKNVPNPGNGGFTLDASIIKINSVSVEEPQSCLGLLTTYSDGYRRRSVIEHLANSGNPEASGAFESYISTEYSEYTLINVDAEQSGANGIKNYSELLIERLSGDCSFIANRVVSLPSAINYDYGDDTGLDSLTLCTIRDFYDFTSSYPAYADIELHGRVREDEPVLDLDVLTEFSINSVADHDFSLVLKIGNKAVSYRDYGNQYMGDDGVREGSYQIFQLEVPVDMIDEDNFDAVAMVTNHDTGEIVNSRILKVGRYDSGVHEVSDYEEPDRVIWYTPDGRILPCQPSVSGMYIRKTATSTRKVII
ncbi:MAG: hypothetical protein K2M87_04305 [Muribaculaceae bacterium]|nr:hypothetical protein [Muribaculaceae bacterium]